MNVECIFCANFNPEKALVCTSCGRDIAIPASLIAERDELVRRRDEVREELVLAKAKLDAFRRNGLRLAKTRG